ncbi:MAG: hypothetical protein ACLP7J_22310 [Streptosporangiaceae bacterium]|jgi:hypothetical protein
MPDSRKAGQDVQSEILDTIRKSQAAVVEALQTWASTAQSITPELPDVNMPFADKLPKPQELIAGAYDFAEQLLASQRKFAEEVMKATAPLLPGKDDATAKSAQGGQLAEALPGGQVPREDFVTTFLATFDRHDLHFPDDLKSYLLDKVIKPNAEWIEGPPDPSVRLDHAANILGEGFDRVIYQAISAGSNEVSREMIDRVLHEVIEAKWHCPWPFYFC